MAQGEQSNIIGKGITIRGSLSGGGDLVIEDGAVFNGSIEMDVKLPEDI